jgi:hypothetical protein
MLRKIFLLATLPLVGCAGSNIETTARYTVETQAVTGINTAAAELSKEKILAIKAIRLAEIAAESAVQLEKIRSMAVKQEDTPPTQVSIETDHCEEYREEYPSQFGKCLDDEIRRSKRLLSSQEEAVIPAITGDNNTVVIGSTGVDIEQGGGGDKESNITSALISGINKNPFVPIPKQPAVSDQSGPWLRFGETVVKTGAVLFGVDRLTGALEAGISKPSVRIDGDYVSQSNNPTTTTTSTEIAEP